MDVLDWAKTLFALIATLSLVGLAAYGARRFGMMQGDGGAKPKRLQVVESLMLDPRRRLILIKLDAREHLLLLSPAGDRVVAATDVKAEGEN